MVNAATVRLKTNHGDVLFDFTPDGLWIYTATCGGGRVSRRKARRLRRALKAWLKATA